MHYEPVPDTAALLIETGRGQGGKRTIIIADLHLGRESELARAGINLPSKTGDVAAEVIAICEKARARDLVLLGDIKHGVPHTSRQEHREIPGFFRTLSEALDGITVVIGNHDAGLRSLMPGQVSVRISGHLIITDETDGRSLGLVHGHRWPPVAMMACDAIIMAHNHPTIIFIDPLGGRSFHQCWIRAPFMAEAAKAHYGKDADLTRTGEIVVMPSFLEFTQGTSFNVPDPDLLGPLLKNGVAYVPGSRIYLLDGTYLGMVRDILVDTDLRGRYGSYGGKGKRTKVGRAMSKDRWKRKAGGKRGRRKGRGR